MAEEWFRRKTWTQEDREAFFARLKRSRGLFHKAQYLRVQAYELAETVPGAWGPGAWGQTEFQVNLKLGLTPRGCR